MTDICPCSKCRQPEPFTSMSVEVTLKFSADEWERLGKWREATGRLESMTSWVQRIIDVRLDEFYPPEDGS